MKLKDLLTEMPEYKPSDLAVGNLRPEDVIYKLPAIEQGFDILMDNEVGGERIMVALAKDKSKAIAGIVKGTQTFRTQVVLDFHSAPNLGEAGKNALQVDLVQATNDQQGTGFGYLIYKAVLNAGYTIVSDNTQYRGGRALWEKIIRRAGQDGHYVMILKDGKYMRDQAGNIIKYDGTNIPAEQIWGRPGSLEHHFTLLVARNN